MVAHACSPGTLKVEAGGLGAQAYVQRDTGDIVSNKKENTGTRTQQTLET